MNVQSLYDVDKLNVVLNMNTILLTEAGGLRRIRVFYESSGGICIFSKNPYKADEYCYLKYINII